MRLYQNKNEKELKRLAARDKYAMLSPLNRKVPPKSATNRLRRPNLLNHRSL